VFDAVPIQPGQTLRHQVSEMTRPAQSAVGRKVALAWLPVMPDDHRYHAASGASRARP
jgi:hypothetical protein